MAKPTNLDNYHEEGQTLTHALDFSWHQDDTGNLDKTETRATHITQLGRDYSTASAAMDLIEQKDCLPSSVAASPLFKLSPELRNMIYRFVQGTGEQVLITKSAGIPEPALLSVNKIVRAEASGLFYDENDFVCEISYFDHATLLLAARKYHIDPASGRAQFGLKRCFIQLHDHERNWSNLVAWLSDYYEEQCDGVGTIANYSAELLLIRALFNMASTARSTGLPTADVLSLLSCMRPALVAHHSDWATV